MTEFSSVTHPVLPLRDIVVFPHMIVPLFVGREKSVRALEEVMAEDRQILLASQVDPSQDDPDTDGIFRVGVLANVLQLLKLPDGTVKVLVEGKSRVRITDFVENDDYFEANAEPLIETEGDVETIRALLRSVAEEFERYAKIKKNIPEEALSAVADATEADKLADLVSGHLGLEVAQKQELLETLDVSERLERVYGLMQGEVSVLQVEKKIKSRVKTQMEKTQREYYLNEQLKAIQSELGGGDGEDGDEIAELAKKIEETKLSKEARAKAESELKKLKGMQPMSAEATVVRNYLDVLLGLPWGKKSKLKKDIGKAQEVLAQLKTVHAEVTACTWRRYQTVYTSAQSDIAGTFRLTYAGATTGQLGYNSSCADVTYALEELGNVYAATCVDEYGPAHFNAHSWTIRLDSVATDAYELLYAEGYLLEGTNARVHVEADTCPVSRGGAVAAATPAVAGRLGQDWVARLSGA
ncbi:LON peptidase substrate-binding domain-containing protein, partial [Thioclava electrotropha]|uniref:LON peptidase substrate-binding domain-containing protein n=1 Tax=Thioclava electrotropha TaxID=1549850 RepID=UPI0023A8F7E2